MKYTKDSGLAQLYARLIRSRAYTMDMVPDKDNLRAAVTMAISDNKETGTA